MGSFGEFFYTGGEWRTEPTDAETYLRIDVHDSDIATVDFRPAHGASGRIFLGYEPRVYFDDTGASAPVSRGAEAAAFRRWVHEVTGAEVDLASIEGLMASSSADDDPIDVFVEETVQRLLALAGLPCPEELPG